MTSRDTGDENAVRSFDSVIGLESMRELYLSERQRRQTIRSQLSIPVSIISFSIFGYVAFAEYFNVTELDAVTVMMDVLMVSSLAFLCAAMIFLARVEHLFMQVEMDTLEDLHDSQTEYQYFQTAYYRTREKNASAARLRAWGFILLLAALACFVFAVALLPFHLADTNVNGRTGAMTQQTWQE